MLASIKGYSVIELMIVLGVMSLIFTGLYGFVVTSSRFYLAQNGIIQMQADGRVAMDFIVRELRSVYGSPTITTNVAASDTISFNRIEETGYSSGGNIGTTFNDTSKSWITDKFANSSSSAFSIRIIGGTGNGQIRTITRNSNTQLTLSSTWVTIPDTSSIYVITSVKAFTRTSNSDNILRYRIGNTGNNNPLVENITSHSFTQPDTDIVRVTLTARTSSLDPIAKAYKSYTITEDVKMRNE